MPKFILASASPQRLNLLNQINIKPDLIVSANIDEVEIKREKPRDYVLRMAKEKAHKVSQDYVDDYVLAADTIVLCSNKILHKPENEAQVEQCLKILSGKSHRVITAISLVLGSQKIINKYVETRVVFKRLSLDEIKAYVQSGEGIGKAGGYSIQGSAGAFVIHIFGSYTNIVGLPLYEVRNLLLSNKCGI